MSYNEHTALRLQIDNLKAKISSAFPISDPGNAAIRMDLATMWRNLNSQFSELDREAVECRRRQRATPKYLELREQVEATIRFIDKRVTWGLML